MALSRRNKKPVVPAGIRCTTSASGARAHNVYRVYSRASTKPTSQQARATSLSPQSRPQHLTLGPRLCPRMHRQSRTNTLHLVPSTSCPPREGRRTRQSWPGRSPLFSQVGRSSPQSWIQTRLNPMSHPRQSIGACLATCPDL